MQIRLFVVFTDDYGLKLVCPPPSLCTDNGVMIAWAGVERYLFCATLRSSCAMDMHVRYIPVTNMRVLLYPLVSTKLHACMLISYI